jgi:predicted Zn-dependent protease
MVTLMAGDAGPMIEDILLEGGALLSLSFSRGQETESDNFAVDLMHEIGRDPEAMAAFFEEMEALQNFRAKDDGGEAAGAEIDSETDNDTNDLARDNKAADDARPNINMEWVSTHPLNEKRIENIRKRAAELQGQ